MATLEELLARLDLSKFAPALAAQDVDLETATMLTEEELGKVGLSLGARKKLYAALHPVGGAASAPSAAAPTPSIASPPPPQKAPAPAPASPSFSTHGSTTPASPAPPPAPTVKKSTIGYKCDRGHLLAVGTAGPKYECFNCFKAVNDPQLATRWRCAECSYDRCHSCAPVRNAAASSPAASSSAPPANAAVKPPAPPAPAVKSSAPKPAPGSSSYACAKGHKMEVITRFTFNCDKCGADGGDETTRWRCAECNYDMCHTCAPVPAGGAGIASPKAPPAPAFKAAPPTAPPAPASKLPTSGASYKCDKGHALAVGTADSYYMCFNCYTTVDDPKLATRWRCAECSYDRCHACAPVTGVTSTVSAAKPPAPPAAKTAPVKPPAPPVAASSASYKCDKGHALAVGAGDPYYMCFNCYTTVNDPTLATRWRCAECSYDRCHACAPVTGVTSTVSVAKPPAPPAAKTAPVKPPAPAAATSSASYKCDKGHALAVGAGDPYYMCFNCYTTVNDPTLATRWRCAECSYDRCHACAPVTGASSSIAGSSTPSSAPAAANDASHKCAKGHPMKVAGAGPFRCDKCRTSSGGEHWRCSECDYDLCRPCAPLPGAKTGPITPLEGPNVINPGFHVLHCGAEGCKMFLEPAKRRGACTVCRRADPSSLESTMGMSMDQAWSAMRSQSNAPPAIGTRLACMRDGCSWSICASCDANSVPNSKLCSRCLSWFASADLSTHSDLCKSFKCANPDCKNVFNRKDARDEHVWDCTRPIVTAMVKKAMGISDDDGGGSDDDDGPSYSRSSSSSSSSSRPARQAKPEKKACSRCNGTRSIKCGRCGGSGKYGTKACSSCGGARSLPCPKNH